MTGACQPYKLVVLCSKHAVHMQEMSKAATYEEHALWIMLMW